MNNRHTGLASVVACLLFCLSSCGDAASRQGVLGGGLECLDAAQPTANDCSVTINFEEGRVPEVKFFRVRWTDPRTSTTTQPSTADVT